LSLRHSICNTHHIFFILWIVQYCMSFKLPLASSVAIYFSANQSTRKIFRPDNEVHTMPISPAASARTPPLARRVPNHLLQALALTSLIFIALTVQVPSSSSLNSLQGFRFPEVHPSDRFEHMFATKTKYWDQRNGESDDNELAKRRLLMASPGLANSANRAPLRQELELLQTQIVARHGTR
jgi:hypothetical protein